MAQALYHLKIEILGDVPNVASTTAMKKEVTEMAEFIAFCYARWCLASIVSYSSPRADIDAIFKVKDYSTINPGIANKCL